MPTPVPRRRLAPESIMRVRPFALLLALTLVACGAETPLSPELTELEEAQARWAVAGVDDYSMQLLRSCECLPSGTAEIEVVDGEIVSITWVGTPPGENVIPFTATVEGLFALIREELAEEPDRMVVTYDEDDGHPLTIAVDRYLEIADDEYSIAVTSLTRR